MARFGQKLVTIAAALNAVAGASASGNVASFISKERPIALQGVLNNIGPNGSMAEGAGNYIIAAPSKVNPDYFYTWTRDSALTMKMLIDEFIHGNVSLKKYIEEYIHAQAILQTVTNPSGSLLPSGAGLGEPKYNADGTRYNEPWGRPQRDGPALRAIALITYSNWLISTGQRAYAKTVVWPVISNDLSYVGQYWNSTGFDLWEETDGSSFFTTQNQYRALVQGSTLANTLGVKCTGCSEAPNVLCFLQSSYWNGDYFMGNINEDNGRSRIDANTILGSIALFDVNAKCDHLSFQPCNTKGLANFKVFVDTFRNSSLYPINEGIKTTSGVALGRYPEDVYYDGNPWYLITCAAAEYLYDAVAQWKAHASLTIDSTSLPFFKDLYPSAKAKTYTVLSPDYAKILSTVSTYADSFVSVVQQYLPANGSISEQFDKSTGQPLSAYDLTWSFAAFVTMSQRRAGQYPASWATAATLPSSTCKSSSTTGTYAPATAAGAPNVTVTCTSTVLFEVNATTYYGENLYLVGNTTDLGAWDIANAQPMNAGNYTSDRPLWYAEVAMTAGEAVSYVYVRSEDCSQGYIYESVNRTLAVPACDASTEGEVVKSTNDAWEGTTGSSGNC